MSPIEPEAGARVHDEEGIPSIGRGHRLSIVDRVAGVEGDPGQKRSNADVVIDKKNGGQLFAESTQVDATVSGLGDEMSTQKQGEYLVSYGEWRAGAETFEQTMRRALRRGTRS